MARERGSIQGENAVSASGNERHTWQRPPRSGTASASQPDCPEELSAFRLRAADLGDPLFDLYGQPPQSLLSDPGAILFRLTYRPLSARGKPGTSFDVQHEDVPAWLLEPVQSWLRPFLIGRNSSGSSLYRLEWIRKLQTRMHLEPPLPWGHAVSTVEALVQRLAYEGLDILDYTLQHFTETTGASSHRAAALNALLIDAGSAWEVTPSDAQGNYALTRRSLGPVVESIEEIRPICERAGAHLMDAWRHLAGRDPLPDQAYAQALLAVEAAAKPIISPADDVATLGKMLAVVRDAPQKFVFELGEPGDVLPVMKALWTTQRRHGTDDEDVPMGMSQAEADAAVHLAITLVRWFVAGAFRRAA
jgi:hypothetical protein